jgi:hypothetical protein
MTLGVAGGCSGDDSAPSEEGSASGNEAPAEAARLTAAAEASMDAESYMMTVSSSGEMTGGLEVTYQAPDRVLVRTTGTTEGAPGDTYVLGQEMLQPNAAAPGRFFRYDLPNDDYIANNVQFPLHLLLDADVVDVDGNVYELRGGDGSGTGRAIVTGDYVGEVTLPFSLDGREVETTYSFTEFGSAPAVQPPDPSLIDEGPAAPECDEDGLDEGQFICLDPN